MDTQPLDEKGFVFIGTDGKPYWCRIYFKEPWLMYWHEANKAWVTLRKIDNSGEIMVAHENKIDNEQAQVYHDLHEKFMG